MGIDHLLSWIGEAGLAEPPAGEHCKDQGLERALRLDRAPAGGEVPLTAGGMSCSEHWSIRWLLGPSGSVMVTVDQRRSSGDIRRSGLG